MTTGGAKARSWFGLTAAAVAFGVVVDEAALIGWLVYGPRGRTSRRVMWLSLLFPLWWFAFTLSRGPFVDFYPYPFVDVIRLGYVKVLVNAGWVGILYLGVAAGAVALDGWLGRIKAVTWGLTGPPA